MATGYSTEVLGIMKEMAPLLGEDFPPAYWISTPDCEVDSLEWCWPCGNYKLRHMRRHDRKRRDEYFLSRCDAESDIVYICAGCGHRLRTVLTTYGISQELDHFEHCEIGEADPRELYDLLGGVAYEFSHESSYDVERRAAVVSVVKKYLETQP